MSRLNELISELCPKGVKYLSLEKVTSAINIGINPRKFFKLNPDDATGFYVTVRELNGLEGVRQYEKTDTINDEAIKIIMDRANIEKGDILFSNTGTVGKMAIVLETPKNWGVNEGIYVIKPLCSLVDSRFLYYYLSGKDAYNQYSKKFTGSTLKHVTQKALRSIQVPVPPLEVQREIVHILDYFTLLTAELTAELIARKKQYEFYRNKLLSHDGKYPMKPLADLGKWSGGKTPSMSEKSFWEQGTIPWISSKDMKASTLIDTKDHITEKAVTEASMTVYPANSVAIVTRSGILKHTFPVAYVPFETTINQDIKMLVVNEDILPRYAFHVIQGKGKDILVKTKKQGGTVDSLDFQKVLAYKVPVPSKDIQSRLVEVLDNFESICTDLNIGLPAEIEARKKQYEYYRDLLLTFAETGSTLMTDRQS